MHRKRLTRRVCSFLISVLLILIVAASGISTVSAGVPAQEIPTVDPFLLAQSLSSDTLTYLIFFREQADLSAAYTMPWEERGWYVYHTLTAFAEETQTRVKKYLDKTGVSYESFWAENVILVESSTSAAMTGLLNFTEIETLQTMPEVRLITPESKSVKADNVEVQSAMSNLTRINADDVWAMGYTGDGMVVGSIDTGVRFTHEALDDRYLGNQSGEVNHNYHWWDAVNNRTIPYDETGHGTHVTGTMVGTDGAGNQIGVAPESAWIACKAFSSSGSAYSNDIYECGQFMLAPWDLSMENINPNKRPQVVNNSWGDAGSTYADWFQSTIDAWLAAGIYPIFAAGNSGPGLNTVGNPARYGNVTGVGATTNNTGEIAEFSSWGPTDNLDTVNPNGYPEMKPQVVAPGMAIRSAVASGDDSYGYGSGTSMAAPHVAGLVSLMWQAAPCLQGNYAMTETVIEQTALPINFDDGSAVTPDSPNYATGWGEIDALAAVTEARNTCGDAQLTGIVYDQNTLQVIPGAVLAVIAHDNFNNDRSGVTDDKGYYEILVFSGETYDINVSKYFYYSQVILDVFVSSPRETVTNDYYLTAMLLEKHFFPLVNR